MKDHDQHNSLEKVKMDRRRQKALTDFPADLEKELIPEEPYPRCAVRIKNAVIYVVAEAKSFDSVKGYGVKITRTINAFSNKAQRVSIIAEVLTPEGYIAMQTGDNVLIARWQEPASCISIDEYKEAVRNHELIGVA